MKNTSKGRSERTYKNKIRRVKKLYNHLTKERKKNPINNNTKKPGIRVKLRPLDYYIGKIKKPNKEIK